MLLPFLFCAVIFSNCGPSSDVFSTMKNNNNNINNNNNNNNNKEEEEEIIITTTVVKITTKTKQIITKTYSNLI